MTSQPLPSLLCKPASASPFSGGTPPLHGTQSLSASSLMTHSAYDQILWTFNTWLAAPRYQGRISVFGPRLSETPSTKLQRNSKSQTPKRKNRCQGQRRASRFLSLVLLWSLEFGACCVVPQKSGCAPESIPDNLVGQFVLVARIAGKIPGQNVADLLDRVENGFDKSALLQ